MKNLLPFFIIISSLLASLTAQAYIPRANSILQRVSENAGSGLYQIEQEVQFPNGADTVVLKETWLVENENNMKLIVTGAKELKDLVSFAVNFSGGARAQNGQSRPIGENFIERYFHIRSPEALAQILVQLKVAPNTLLSKRPIKSLKDVESLPPESFIRLSRVGGGIAYAFGIPVNSDQDNQAPGVWIEQDQFVLRKIRLPDQSEVSADRYSNFSHGLSFPRTRVVRWGTNQVTIQTISVSARAKSSWAAFGLKAPPRMDGLNNQAAAAVIEDFYRRFR